MSLAWLTLIGAAIGIQSRSHFSLSVFVHRLPVTAQCANPSLQLRADCRRWPAGRLVRRQTLPAQPDACDPRPANQPGLALRLIRGRRRADRHLRHCGDDLAAARQSRALRRIIHAACDGCRHLRFADPAFDADRVRAGSGRNSRTMDRRLSDAAAFLRAGVGFAELGAARHPCLHIRRQSDGTLRHEPRPGGAGARPDRLGQGRPRHVGDRCRILFLRHLRIEDGGSVGARLGADAAADQGRVRPPRFRLR